MVYHIRIKFEVKSRVAIFCSFCFSFCGMMVFFWIPLILEFLYFIYFFFCDYIVYFWFVVTWIICWPITESTYSKLIVIRVQTHSRGCTFLSLFLTLRDFSLVFYIFMLIILLLILVVIILRAFFFNWKNLGGLPWWSTG